MSVRDPSTTDGTEEDRLTKYFSDANVVNLVGCVWQTPPTPSPPHVPIHQEQLLGARLTCHHHRASHQQSCQTPTGPGNLLWNYLQPFVSSLSSASDTMCVIRPLVSLTMEPYSRLLQQIPYILFIISLIAELNISRSGVRFICSLNFPLWVSGKHRRPRVGSLPQLSPDMNMNQWSMIIFPSPVFSWPGRQSTNKKKCKTQYEEYDSSESQCYYPQMLLLSLPNDLHIKSCRFPIVNLPTGTGRTCTASSVSCGDQRRAEAEPEISLNITELELHRRNWERLFTFTFCFVIGLSLISGPRWEIVPIFLWAINHNYKFIIPITAFSVLN